ncbi:hypothetical protein O181_082181 [Austropuccinia psidii MF-1]|uniref:Uncharacterized protein n=1 Tax=Austropuccinia psidii MF-1 TaxID=1389203 RepID=A0A9Q3FS37_9BASI|nr:hypothetical protein [Austropuccinia psidii MF-1]
MASIDGKEKHDSSNRRIEEKQPSTTQANAQNSPNSQKQQLQCKKAATSSEEGQRESTSLKPYSQGYIIFRIQQDAMENVFQMARKMMELQKKEEARLKCQKLFVIC